MKLKRDTKFGTESTRRFKFGIRNLTKFDTSARKSQKFSFWWAPFEQSIYCLSKKSTDELSLMKLKSDAKSEEKLTYCLENDMRNFANFYQSTQKYQNWNFDKMLLSKVENVWALNLHWSYICHDNEE